MVVVVVLLLVEVVALMDSYTPLSSRNLRLRLELEVVLLALDSFEFTLAVSTQLHSFLALGKPCDVTHVGAFHGEVLRLCSGCGRRLYRDVLRLYLFRERITSTRGLSKFGSLQTSRQCGHQRLPTQPSQLGLFRGLLDAEIGSLKWSCAGFLGVAGGGNFGYGSNIVEVLMQVALRVCVVLEVTFRSGKPFSVGGLLVLSGKCACHDRATLGDVCRATTYESSTYHV